MNQIIKLILSLSLSGSILIILIFALKPFIKHKLSKSIQYYIWVIVLLRLVIPFSFEGSFMNNVFYKEQVSTIALSQGEVQSIMDTGENISYSSILPNVQKNTANIVYSNAIHWRYFKDLFNKYISYLWLLGVIISITVNLTGYAKFLKYLKKSNKPATEEDNRVLTELLNHHLRCCKINDFRRRFRLPLKFYLCYSSKPPLVEVEDFPSEMSLKGQNSIKLIRNPYVTTPMLVGIIKPSIIISDINFDEKQLKNILLHEITHLKRFDIEIKWLTMIATSIHWFNPFMYFIKKEINNACELACDESVIKNFNSAEKQAYGDTLISVVAEQKYNIGVLQATMCEEKKSLKERLVAIMKHTKKSKSIIVCSVVLLGVIIFGALYLGAGVGFERKNPPNLYISAEDMKTKVARTGSYNWSYGGEHIAVDSLYPTDFQYKSADNIVSVTNKQQLILSTQNLKKDKKYDFTIEKVSVYKDKQLIKFPSAQPSFMNGDIYILAPPETGEYVYVLTLNFKDKGTVTYGFVVRVDMFTYDLSEISKYKTPYIGDSSKVGTISNLLPIPNNYFKHQYFSMETSKRPYGLTIYYEAAKDGTYEGNWPTTVPKSVIEGNSRLNALVLFCMIDNLDEVTFAFRNSQSDGNLDESKYNANFTFIRAFAEKKYGDLSVLRNNLNLLQDALTGK